MLDQMMKMLEGQQIGSYRLNTFLGAGSFGGVFHASEIVRNTSVQEVAVKVIPESSDDKLTELQNARKLEHSNLIKTYSVGEFRFMNIEMLYLVMELAQGSLENHIAKGDLSLDEIKHITAQVAQGLSYLHSQNKIHRDLKPGNILKINQQYKLADFGLIRTLNNKSYTQTVHNSGTIVYMPPEAFRGDISAGWDIWSLGIMLIEMTTNQFPYKFNNDINQLINRVMNCDLQIPVLPREFKLIVEGCLQKDRRQRWTAQQVLNALQTVRWTSSSPSQKIQTSSSSPKPEQKSVDNYLTLPQKKYAGFFPRICAFAVDCIPFYAMLYGVFAFFSAYEQPFFTIFSILGSIIVFIIMGLYFALMESSNLQATLGKLIYGIIVTDLKGRRISFIKANIRYYNMFLTLGMGVFIIPFTKKKQGLHDKVSGCLVLIKEVKKT